MGLTAHRLTRRRTQVCAPPSLPPPGLCCTRTHKAAPTEGLAPAACPSAQVVLDNSAVEREAARLARENADLRQLLANFLNGISVNAAVLDEPANPLLVVNGKLQAAVAARQKRSQQRGGDGAAGALGALGLALAGSAFGGKQQQQQQQQVVVASVGRRR